MSAPDLRSQAVPRPFLPRRAVPVVLGLLLLAACALSLGMGSVVISPSEVWFAFLHRIGLDIGAEPSFRAEAVLWDIRLPRILLGLLVGAALAVTGAVLQGLYRNQLADPHLLGIGPGAALGGALGSISGGVQGAIAGATAAAIATALITRRLGATRSLDPSRFILTGVALGAALTAWVGFIVFASDSTKVPPIQFWLLGSLTGSTWRALVTVAVIVGVGLSGLFFASRILDLFALGESEARHLGVDVDLATATIVMAVGAIVGATVGAVGVVVFVGLLVPHIVRRFTGPAHRPLLVSSALGGGLFVVLADLLARTLADPVDIPVGLLTAAVGGPFFLWLIRKPPRGEPT